MFYIGEEREFDLAALDEAFAAFAFSVGSPEQPTVGIEAGKGIVTASGLKVSGPLRPAPRD